MSGHSKWANIKHKKGKADAQRNKIFTKIGREIALAVKEGGSEPDSNNKLRDVINKAKANNMPNDTITRAIKKAAGELGNVNYEEFAYEGYAPGGVAVIVEVVTDNRNRTASDVRHIFDKNGGSLGQTGSVSFMFDYKGILVLDKALNVDEEELMLQALEAGAEDVQDVGEAYEIITAANDFAAVREALEKGGLEFVSTERAMIPHTSVAVDDPETLEKIQKLLDMLDDNDDVSEVYHNGDLPEEPDED